eukprot:maker-scaffold1580_size34946-snap-gene-0.9 protein:Tk04077 transcript:maker-scaffold1580_size34946-snap-gene-0.9-mRNA-1 annotation:"lactosylceramide 4-alpha-galactosyltransferase"
MGQILTQLVNLINEEMVHCLSGLVAPYRGNPIYEERVLGSIIFVLFVFYRVPLELDSSQSAQFADISSSNLRGSNAIFFVETNPNTTKLNGRLLCAVERASQVYPLRKIVIVLNVPKVPRISKIPRFLASLANVQILQVDVSKFVEGTLVEHLWASGQVQGSRWFLSNLSNLLRFLLIYEYGGMYLDQDVLCLKRVPDALSNFVGLVEPKRVASGIFQLESNHPVTNLSLGQLFCSNILTNKVHHREDYCVQPRASLPFKMICAAFSTVLVLSLVIHANFALYVPGTEGQLQWRSPIKAALYDFDPDSLNPNKRGFRSTDLIASNDPDLVEYSTEDLYRLASILEAIQKTGTLPNISNGDEMALHEIVSRVVARANHRRDVHHK